MTCCGPIMGADVGATKVAQWNFLGGTTTLPPGDGMIAPLVTGTATARVVGNNDILDACPRLGCVSAAAIDSVAGPRSNVLFAATGLDVGGTGAGRYRGAGYKWFARVAISDAVLNTEARMFLGMRNNIAVPTAVSPPTITTSCGFYCDNGDTTLHFFTRDSIGNNQTFDLGASFPVNVTGRDAFWDLQIEIRPGQTQTGNPAEVRWRAERLQTGHTAQGIVTGVGSVPLGVFHAPQLWRATGPVNAAAVGLDVALVRVATQL